jgi:hypothetical protein
MGNKIPKERYVLLEHQDMPSVSCIGCDKVFTNEKMLAIHGLMHNTFDASTNWRNLPDPDVDVYWTYNSLSDTGYYFMNATDCKLLEKAFKNNEESLQTTGKYPFTIDFVQGKQLGSRHSRKIQRITRDNFNLLNTQIDDIKIYRV